LAQYEYLDDLENRNGGLIEEWERIFRDVYPVGGASDNNQKTPQSAGGSVYTGNPVNLKNSLTYEQLKLSPEELALARKNYSLGDLGG
jgi:hypothetical protein